MNDHPAKPRARVLIVGRSPKVLTDAADKLRAKGYSADATNQFDQVLTDYDTTELDILVFGGMVPPDVKKHLREQVGERNPDVTFIQGLAGIAGVIAAQVEAADSAGVADHVVYDSAQRKVELALSAPSQVTVEALWATSFTPPEPKSASAFLWSGRLDAGHHTILVPDRIPPVASFAVVSVGPTVRVLTIGAMPAAVTRMVPETTDDRRLPSVRAVTTHGSAPESRTPGNGKLD
ncbi:hypothetical protein [Diaminobutyricibacter sp. McL0608]|uniref:hypothetical protein n=1 Tax=Leifsonia sp. McL0608 TaxID=3143537 RepID=UPI0031F321EC